MKLSVGYGCKLNVTTRRNKEKLMTIKIELESSSKKLLHPLRFGKNLMAHRKYSKCPSMGNEIPRKDTIYAGMGRVVVTKISPITLVYYTKTQKVNTSCYIQRYDANDFALDTAFQAMLNGGYIFFKTVLFRATYFKTL